MSDAALTTSGKARNSGRLGEFWASFAPILAITASIIAIWYLACVPMNVKEVLTQAERGGAEVIPPSAIERRDAGRIGLIVRNFDLIGPSWSMERARLPAPHQVALELWVSTWGEEVYGRRGIVQSGTLSSGRLSTMAALH